MSTLTENAPSLSSIADDIVRKTLTFLTPADCTRGPAAASKAMRVVASTANRQRYVDNYVLRGDKHGVVHALATALGTRRWPTRQVHLRVAQLPKTHPWRWAIDLPKSGWGLHSESFVRTALEDARVRPVFSASPCGHRVRVRGTESIADCNATEAEPGRHQCLPLRDLKFPPGVKGLF